MDTDYGSFNIKKYYEMSEEEQVEERNTFRAKFRILNEKWEPKYSFELPREDESLRNMAIRHSQSIKFLSMRSGLFIKKLILVAGWSFIEIVLTVVGIPCKGYTQCQLEMYETYEVYLIEMGENSGFGENLSPFTKILITSFGSMVLLVLLNFALGDPTQSEVGTRTAVSLIAKMLNGSSIDEDGNPIDKKDFDFQGFDIKPLIGKLPAILAALNGSNNNGEKKEKKDKKKKRKRKRKVRHEY